MKVCPSYQLTTDELKQAIIEYINSRTDKEYTQANIDGFSVTQDSSDVRLFKTWISLGEETV